MPKKQKPNPLTSPATPKQIRKEARGATKAQYGPLRREVKAEQRASKLQQKRIGQEFGHYDTALDKAAQATTGAYGTAGAQIAQTSQTTADYAETLRQRLQKEASADAATRGAAPDQTGSQTLAAATLARLNSANVLSAVTASQGATASSYLQDKKRIGGREEIEQKLRESQRRRSYDSDLRDIAKDAGAYKVAKKAEITDRERDFLLAQQAAHLNKKGQKIDARQTAASQAETRRHNSATEANSAAEEARMRAENRYERRHPNAGEEGDKPDGGGKRLVGELQAATESIPPTSTNAAGQALKPGTPGYKEGLLDTALKQYQYLYQHRREIINKLKQAAGDPTGAQATKAYSKALAAMKRRVAKEQRAGA